MFLNVKSAEEQKSGKQNSGLTKLINVAHPQQIIKLKHWKKTNCKEASMPATRKFSIKQ